jgi:hypothetical protein
MQKEQLQPEMTISSKLPFRFAEYNGGEMNPIKDQL